MIYHPCAQHLGRSCHLYFLIVMRSYPISEIGRGAFIMAMRAGNSCQVVFTETISLLTYPHTYHTLENTNQNTCRE